MKAAPVTGGAQEAHGSIPVRVRALIVIAGVSTLGVVVVYLVFVRTAWGQRVDDLAFDGREVEDPEVTRALNDLLHSVTRSTLFLLTAAIVAIGLARRRLRLAVAAGAAISASVITSELLKTQVFSRPQLDDVEGIVQNSYPSGHATIGMAVSLGIVMVAPHRSRWLATAAALLLSTTFGVGVLATGWHRPSDTIGAYLVCAMWFAATTAVLLRWRGAPVPEGAVEGRLAPRQAALAGVLAIAAGVIVVVSTFQAEGLRTVEFAADYLIVCAVIIGLAAVVVIGYAQLLRGVDLDATSAHSR